MNLIEIIKLSIENLLSFKFRSFLTMLGIIMGIASVVLLTSLGEGFNSKILDDAKSSTANLIMVSVKNNNTNYKESDLFTKTDEKQLSKIYNVEGASLYMQIFMQEEKTERFVKIDGVNENYLDIFGKQILKGYKFDTNTSSDVVIISQNTAKTLFPNTDPIGKDISLNDFEGKYNKYKIVGVYNGDYDRTADIFGKNIPFELLMPMKLVNRLTYNINDSYEVIVIKVKDAKKTKETVEVLKKYVDKKGSSKDLYDVKPISEDFNQISGILGKITLFVNLVAGISIIVGGIGVMNIMLVSVKERIAEIGLRKAIGAKNRDILIQFLIETVILTLIGGLIGILIGYSLALLVGLVIKIVPILKINVLVTAFLISSITGLVFGIYPAKQAAKLSPMEALRKE